MVDEYQSQADEFALFTRDCIIRKQNGSIGVTDLFVLYQQWCKVTSQMAMPEKTFTKKMSSRYAKKRVTQGMVFLDILPKTDGWVSAMQK